MTAPVFGLCLGLVISLGVSDAGDHIRRHMKHLGRRDLTGKPLILTTYIKNGRLEEGRRAAEVTPIIPGIRSYSGFLTVNKTHNSHMFFWYFPPISNGTTMSPKAYNKDEMFPVVLWLQGGPGSSSMFAALRELGPLHLNEDDTLVFNPYSWADQAHLFFIDNPVGTGFSFSDESGYSTNLSHVTDNLFSAVSQFLELFGLQNEEFYITGESYAGKYIPSLGARIHEMNQKNQGEFPINLRGVAIGNGLVDPPNMMDFGDYLYQLGMIDIQTRRLFNRIRDKIKLLIDRNELLKAQDLHQKWIQGDITKTPSLFTNVTGLHSYFNFLQIGDRVNEKKLLKRFFKKAAVAEALHTNGVKFMKHNEVVHEKLRSDLLLSEVEHLKLLMNHYRVLLYHGQLDIKDSYPLMLNYLRKIKWKNAEEYRHARRELWTVDGLLAGYYKSAGDFTEMLVRDASHMVPSDQPEWAHAMIMNFIYKRPFSS